MTTLEPPPKNLSNTPNGEAMRNDGSEKQPKFISRHLTEDRICILTFDRPGTQANLFDKATLEQMEIHLDAIARISQLRGLVLISAKPSIFIAGADIRALSEQSDKAEVRNVIELGQRVFNRLSNLPIPKVAAIHGACVGGGFEVCLACDYRIASNDKSSKIGLPETKLGILPGWGGTTRLARLIGLPAALDIILNGKVISARSACKRGMVDEITTKENLIEASCKVVRSKGHRLLQRRVSLKMALSNSGWVGAIIRWTLKGKLKRKTRGHYPAITKALDIATRGIGLSLEGSLLLERDAVLELAQSKVCQNLIRTFFLQERAKKIASSTSHVAEEIRNIAVVGAGVMGAGIAQWSSSKGIKVILRDITAEHVAKGMRSVAKLYSEGAKRRVFNPVEVKSGMDRIFPVPHEVSLKNTDIVIEAAVEKMELKRSIFERLATLSSSKTILASNTSALSISELAECIPYPERVIGIHFFNPVHRMQLVEVVVGRSTAKETIQRSLRFVHQIGKLPVVVRDSPGFLVNRVLMPYLVEAGHLFEQGASIENIDGAMLDFGMPMGPLRLIDEVGVDVAQHVSQTLSDHFPGRFGCPDVLRGMIQMNMLGRKTGSGFFKYSQGGKEQTVSSRIASLKRDDIARGFSREQLSNRMVLLMINEAARCLEEHIVEVPEDVDFGMIMGTGFAPFRGGPLKYADDYGVKNIVRDMEKLAEEGHTQFIPSEILVTMARLGKGFYQQNGAQS